MSQTYYDYSIKVDSNNVPSDSLQYYIPKIFLPAFEYSKREHVNKQGKHYFKLDMTYKNDSYDKICLEWYSKMLFGMHEPLLFNRKTGSEIYRFTWLRTFDNPIVIKIENIGTDYILCWKLSDGAGGYEPGKVIINKTIKIDKSIWDEFKSKIAKSSFWNMKRSSILGTDGSEWILEGADSTKYHAVDIWSPGSGAFYDCCNYLIKQTDLTIPDEDKY